jgi:uncharacterized membrane protein affecting hemolysin expression
MGWVTLALMVLSGLMIIQLRTASGGGPPANLAWKIKMGSIAALILMQVLMQLRLQRWAVHANLFFAVVTMVFASWTVR